MSEAVQENVSQELDSNMSEDSSENSQEGVSQSEQQEQKAQQQKRYLDEKSLDDLVKIKIDGKVHELPIREVVRLQSLEKASQERMQKAAKITKQVEQFFDWAKTNPRDFLKQTGIDPVEFSEATLAEQYELMQMTPEQKELMEHRKWREQWEREQAEQQEKQKQMELTKREQAYMQSVEKEFIENWPTTGLPKHKRFMALTTAKILGAAKVGKDLQVKDAASMVKNEWLSDTREILASMSPEEIQQTLGDVTLKKLKEWDIKRVTDKAASKLPNGKSPASAVSNKNQKTKPMSEVEWKQFIEQRRSQLTD